MAKTIDLKAKDCGVDCPFYEYDPPYGAMCRAHCDRGIVWKLLPDRKPKRPEWCPLPVTVWG